MKTSSTTHLFDNFCEILFMSFVLRSVNEENDGNAKQDDDDDDDDDVGDSLR